MKYSNNCPFLLARRTTIHIYNTTGHDLYLQIKIYHHLLFGLGQELHKMKTMFLCANDATIRSRLRRYSRTVVVALRMAKYANNARNKITHWIMASGISFRIVTGHYL